MPTCKNCTTHRYVWFGALAHRYSACGLAECFAYSTPSLSAGLMRSEIKEESFRAQWRRSLCTNLMRPEPVVRQYAALFWCSPL